MRPSEPQMRVWVLAVAIFSLCSHLATAHVFYNVTCGSESMLVRLNVTSRPPPLIYLQNLKGYPGCEPELEPGQVLFRLSLNDTIHCGVSKMLNKQTGHSIYYHRIVIEVPDKELELLFVQCVIPGDFNMDFVRLDWQRESLPVNNMAEELLSVGGAVINGSLPYPQLTVRDRGTRLDPSALVRPGSLLDLLLFLDKDASDRYGLSLRYLSLTDDTRSQEEVIVMNGCSVDPYVIQVFRPSDGVLRSQFRAFKFQRSEFVIFLATVNVCLHRCVEVECYGADRRKREIPHFLPHYRNEVFEAELTAFLRLESIEGDIVVEESTNETLDTFYESSEDYVEEEISEAPITSGALIVTLLCWTVVVLTRIALLS